MKIFISSIFRDLQAERWEMLNGFKKAGSDSWGMEFFSAQPDTPKDACLTELAASDLVILVIGDRHGSIDPETGKSFTQLEYEKAKEERKDILTFLKHNIPPDAEYKEQPESFREVVAGNLTSVYFSNPAELYNEVWAALFRTLKTKGKLFRTSNTFEYFCDFFADTLNEARLFNHTHKLVGRNDELSAIDNFVQSDDKRMLIVSAAGGVGKTKLLYEYSKPHIEGQGEYSVRYVSGYGTVCEEALEELPSNHLLIIIDDAHLNNDIEQLLKLLLEYKYRDMTKLIIATRPSGFDRIKRALCRISAEDNVLAELHLETLDAATFAKEPANEVLGPAVQRYADQLVRASGGNAPISTIAGQLLTLGKVDSVACPTVAGLPEPASTVVELPKLAHTKRDAASILSVKPSAIDWLLRKGELGHRMIARKVRITPEDLREYLELAKVPATVAGAAATQKGDEQ